MPLYLETCRRNPDIRWLMFSNQSPPADRPPNVEFFQVTLAQLSMRLMRTLQMNIALENPYKLCDFKITYGVTFAEYLRDVDFWGMCDLDVFWGYIRRFYPDELLRDYDVLTSERCCFNGQCTLFRNVSKVNSLFLRIPNVRERLEDPGIHFLDENQADDAALFMERADELRVLRRKIIVQARYYHFAESWGERLELEEKGHLRDMPPLLHSARWENGHLYHLPSGREALLYHIGSSKENYRRRAKAYFFEPDAMSGWVMTVGKIKMRFRPGHLRARWNYFLKTTRGPDILGRIRNIPDTLRAFNVRRRVHRFLRSLLFGHQVGASPQPHSTARSAP
jgi:hypothetical protein